MTRLLGGRGAAALGTMLLALVGGASDANAEQVQAKFPVVQAVATTAPSTTQLIKSSFSLPSLPQAIHAIATTATAPLAKPGFSFPAVPQAAQRTIADLPALVSANRVGEALDEQAQCLATAVYFEARGEPLEGQLAVANVVMNRANSGQYPADWCGVIKQKAQFSFVRNGQFPQVDTACDAWARSVAIARIAAKNLVAELPTDVLWYHANYVAPSWGRRLTRVDTIGAHIFYRA